VKPAGNDDVSVVDCVPNGQPRLVSQYCRIWCTWITIACVPGSVAEIWIDPSVTRSGVARSVCVHRTTAPLEAVNLPVMARRPVPDSRRRGVALILTERPAGRARALQAALSEIPRGTWKWMVAAA
jgi:hypothetical protein